MSDALWNRASLMTVISAKALLTVIAAQAGTHARMHALATSVGCSIDDALLLSAQRGEVGAQRRMRGERSCNVSRTAPLTRPAATLSPCDARGEETAFGLLCAIAFPNDAAHKWGGYTP